MFRQALLVVASLSFAGVTHAQPDTKPAQKTSTKKPAAKSSTKTAKPAPKTAKTAKTAKATKPATKKSAKRTGGKQTAARVDSKKTGTRDKTRGRKDKTAARVPWIPNQKTLSNTGNQPLGFTWPPTHAMLEAEKTCESKLDRAGVVWEHSKAEGRVVDPIVVPSMTFGGIKYTNMWGSKGPHVLDCQLALALETIGPELHALGVREVKYGSIYRWSNVRSGGVTKPYLSRHGLGLAMDIGSFVDEAGRNVVVENDYKTGDALLHGIEQLINANGNFRIVLTPKNDPISHHNHFHIEAKADYTSPDLR
jgi:hypothetical protein